MEIGVYLPVQGARDLSLGVIISMNRSFGDLFALYADRLSVLELATVLDVSEEEAFALLESGEVPSYRIGIRWLILRDEVKQHVQRRFDKFGCFVFSWP